MDMVRRRDDIQPREAGDMGDSGEPGEAGAGAASSCWGSAGASSRAKSEWWMPRMLSAWRRGVSADAGGTYSRMHWRGRGRRQVICPRTGETFPDQSIDRCALK